MSQHFEKLLCKACKFLSIDQIKSLKNHSGIVDGIDWYSQHLWLDCQHNDNDALDTTPTDKQIALNELNRIGFEVKECKGGSELIECSPQNKKYPY
jgi:hypothetical protein